MVIKYSTTFAELFISVVPLFFLQVSIYIIDKENLRWILCLSNSGKNITVTVASSDSVCSPVPTTVSLCAISKMVFWLFYIAVKTDAVITMVLLSLLQVTVVLW